MSEKKYIKINKQRRLVKEAIARVLSKRKDMLLEIKNRQPRRDYRDLSLPRPERTHKPEYIHREFVPGEFEVFFDHKMYHLNEGREEQYPETLDTKFTIQFIKQNYGDDTVDNLEFYPSFRSKKDSIACAVVVSMQDDTEFRIYEQPLIMLDELFHECGYFRVTPDKVFIKEGQKTAGVRSLQYEPYHYSSHKRLIVPKTIYHATTRDCRDSILKEGFIASCKPVVDWVQYPPRNFFFTKHDADLIVDYMFTSQKIGPEEKVNPVTFFHISTERLNNVRFYSDPLFNEKEAIYTYDDIAPEHIDHYIDTVW